MAACRSLDRTEQRRAAGYQSSLDPRGISKIGTRTAQADRGDINKAWFLTVLLFAVVATMNAVLMLPPLLVDIAAEFGVSVSVTGQLATVTFGFWAVSVLLASPLSDSFGRRPVAVVGLLVLSVSVMASAFASNFYVLLALRILTGLGGGTIPPNAIAAVSDIISPERRGQAVGGLMAVNVLTAAMTVPIMALLADWGNWRLPFLVSGLMLAASLVTVWLWLPGNGKGQAHGFAFLSRYWSLLSLQFFRIAFVAGITQRMMFWGSVSFFAAYLIATHGVSVGFVALPLAITAVGQAAASLCVGHAVKNRRRAAFITAASLVAGVCGLLTFSGSLGMWAAVAAATVGTGMVSLNIAALMAMSTEFSGESKATGAAIVGLSNQSGGMFGAALAGLLLANVGFQGIGYMCLGTTLVSALMTGVVGRRFAERKG